MKFETKFLVIFQSVFRVHDHGLVDRIDNQLLEIQVKRHKKRLIQEKASTQAKKKEKRTGSNMTK